MDFPHLIRKHTTVGPVSLTLSFCARSVAQSCPILCSAMHCSPPGSSVHGIFQARILKSASISYSRGSSGPRGPICVSWVSCTGRWIPYQWAAKEAPSNWLLKSFQVSALLGSLLTTFPNSSELDIECWSLGLKGCVSFFQCLNFIHLADIWCLLIHILPTLAPAHVSELSFNVHGQVQSACWWRRGCLPWSFLSSHPGCFCWSCGLSLVLVNVLTEVSYTFCVNVTFAMFLS